MNTIELRKLVNEIRSFVNAADQTADDHIASLATEFADVCQAINDRLARCADLLEKGNRSEALALAEEPPDILEAITILNFPEIDEWQELCGQYKWKRPPSLQIAVANSINDAYAKQTELNGLLGRHRLLALQRAPLGDRLAVLRQIMSVDRLTNFWQEDVERYEAARFGELIQLGNRAQHTSDAAAASRFLEEYRAENWHSKVPSELSDRFAALATAFDSAHVLPRMAGEIAEAASALNLRQLDKAAENWNRVVSRNIQLRKSWQPPAHLLAKVSPGLQYLMQQKESRRQRDFFDDVRALHKAMLELVDTEKVDFLVAKAESHGYELPTDVQADLAAYRRGEQRESALNVMLVVSLAGAGIFVLVLGYLAYKLISG
jgi:hypothetical protein